MLVTLFGLLLSARASTWAIDPRLAVYAMPPVISLLWLGLLALRGSFDRRIIGLGTEEIRRVTSATLLTFAVVAGISYLIRADISRAYAFVSLPLGLVLIVSSRFLWRGWLYRRRARGDFMYRTVVVGGGAGVGELERRLTDNSYAGYQVTARYVAPLTGGAGLTDWLDGLDDLLASEHATALALSLPPSDALASEAIHQIAWRIEGRAIELLMAPAVLDITGPRLSVRPAAGLPLLHLNEAVLSRSQAFSKRALDIIGAAVLLVLLSPVLLACTVAVRVSSRGPVVFRQRRIGRGGEEFTVLKFRTMVDGADAMRAGLRDTSGGNDPMFKLAGDPRITATGAFLRRWSLDELPQLVNVIRGHMSLVGPRPHPLDDVDRYEAEAYRRLALKPGLTGLWQVQGRSELSWREALHLDMYYVETWTLSGDLVLLARTVRAVVQGRGAV
jgi:exopolysaccharide biosynthesis polyprenyl glycosylphosphotransferase